MGFQSAIEGEHYELAALRATCRATLSRISAGRSWFLGTCHHREEMAGLGDGDRLAVFGGILSIAKTVGHSGSWLPEEPDEFIEGLEIREERPRRVSISDILLGRRGPDTAADNRIREKVIEALCTWPGFDGMAARRGAPQHDDFMCSFRVDYPLVRELAAEMRRPFTVMMQIEADFGRMVAIHDDFIEAAHEGIDPARIGVRPREEAACSAVPGI